MRRAFGISALLHRDRTSTNTERNGQAPATRKILRSPHSPLTVSLKTLATMLDAHRSSVRRWLHADGIRPVVLGRGRNGAIRYRWADVEAWLASLPQVD
jgi:hypothetical protein